MVNTHKFSITVTDVIVCVWSDFGGSVPTNVAAVIIDCYSFGTGRLSLRQG